MTTSETLKQIAEYLDKDFKYKVEISALAKTALQGRYNLVSDGAALIYCDTIDYVTRELVDGRYSPFYRKELAIVISVGTKKINDDGLELLDLIDQIEDTLSFKTFGSYRLAPVAVSSSDGDIDSVYWKQIWFRASQNITK